MLKPNVLPKNMLVSTPIDWGLRIIAILFDIAMILCSIFTLAEVDGPQVFFVGMYLLVLPFISLLVELRIALFMRKFAFIHSFSGRGIFYIFFGSIACGGKNAAPWFGVLMIIYAVGLVLVGYTLPMRSFEQLETLRRASLAPKSGKKSKAGAAGEAGVDGGVPRLSTANNDFSSHSNVEP